jgi:hypothetical protein
MLRQKLRQAPRLVYLHPILPQELGKLRSKTSHDDKDQMCPAGRRHSVYGIQLCCDAHNVCPACAAGDTGGSVVVPRVVLWLYGKNHTLTFGLGDGINAEFRNIPVQIMDNVMLPN